MTSQYMEFDLTPVEESCAELGCDDYYRRSHLEYDAISSQLIREFGEPPSGVYFKLATCPHDFGPYHELRIHYNHTYTEGVEYVYKIEAEFPLHWDDISLKYLREFAY